MKPFMKTLIVLLSVCMYLTGAKEPTEKYYQANWDSLRHYQVPQWYEDAKFGIWTHWGAYAVPAYRGTHAAEWYPRWMYLVKDPDGKPFNSYDQQGAAIAQHHIDVYGGPENFGYHDFIPMFRAENWDPKAWAQLGIDSGAKFFTITGMHHDGFALYDSDYTQWDSVDMGPKRDLVGDLARAVREKGLKFGISNHFANNKNFYGYFFKNGFDKIFKERPELKSLYSEGKLDDKYINRWWNITTEMARKYHPDLYYFDWGWNPSFWEDERPEFCAYFYNQAIRRGRGVYGNPDVVINYKNNSVAKGCAVLDLERASMNTVQNFVWQTDTSVSDHSWGYSVEDTFKSPKTLITTLVDIVSKNGILMLNFGPKADGTVPKACRWRLLEMGKWLKANGEAIYGSRPWAIAEEGPTDSNNKQAGELYGCQDIRYTRSQDSQRLYATAFGLPQGHLTLMSCRVNGQTDGARVTMLANGKSIPFSINAKKQLVLDFSEITPQNAGCDYAYSFRLEGFDIQPVKLNALERSEAYLGTLKDYTPLPGTFGSSYPYLSAFNALYEKAHNGVKRDINYYGRDLIKIGGRDYKHGLMVCPAGDFGRGIFLIGTEKLAAIQGFRAQIGIDDAMTTAGSCAFIIEAKVNGDWQRLYQSRVLTWKNDAVSVDVRIPEGTKFIRFITTDGGNGCNADHAVWADAQFY